MATKTLKGLKNVNPDNLGQLRNTRMSEISTEVRAQNLAHTNQLKKQLNEWYKEQHIAVHKLSHGQQKLFRNLIKVENDKRRIERQNHIKKQEQLRQKLRERALKEREEALKRAMEQNMLSLALKNDNEKETGVKKSPNFKLPKIKQVPDVKRKDVLRTKADPKKKSYERNTALEPLIDIKRPLYSRERLERETSLSSIRSSVGNRTTVLPAIHDDLKISAASVTHLKSDFEIIDAVSEANEAKVDLLSETQKITDTVPSQEKLPNTSRATLSTPHFKKYNPELDGNDVKTRLQQKSEASDQTWNPEVSQTRTTNVDGPPKAEQNEKQKLKLRSPPVSNISDIQLNTKHNTNGGRTKLNQSVDIEKLPSDDKKNLNLNSNQVLPPINKSDSPISETKSNTSQVKAKRDRKSSNSSNTSKNKKRRKLKERQSLIDDMHRYHIGIADARRYTIPDFVAPPVDSVVKYNKTSQGSFVSSDIVVKPAAEDFKLPSKKSDYLLQKALQWEQGREEPRKERLDHFYNQVDEYIDKSKRPTIIPKPKVPQQPKDILPSRPLEQTIQSRTFGTSLEGYHLRHDVQDLQNCRYLRFKDTKNTLNDDVDDEPAPTHSKRKMSSWGHLQDLPITRPKLSSIY